MIARGNVRPGSLYLAAQSRNGDRRSETQDKGTLIGYGKSFSSFGEIVQGRLSNEEDFLVTLPIDLWSTCELVCRPINGPLIIECELEKSRSVLHSVLEELGVITGFHVDCRFTRNIPVGKGLSSSTADMLAALRAIQEVFGLLLTETFISRVFASIEPHDAVHYNSCVAYNHRSGTLLANFGYIPQFTIVVVDGGGEIDTLEYNRSIVFSRNQKSAFDRLYEDIKSAFDRKDDAAIAACATRSASLLIERTTHPVVKSALTKFRELGAEGVVATHSGTCVGLLYPHGPGNPDLNNLMSAARKCFGKEPFLAHTLTILS